MPIPMFGLEWDRDMEIKILITKMPFSWQSEKYMYWIYVPIELAFDKDF